MDFKLICTESAIEDLGAIVRFISGCDGLEIARQTGFGIYDRAQILSSHPEGGKYSPSLEVAFRIAHVFHKPLEEVFQYIATSD